MSDTDEPHDRRADRRGFLRLAGAAALSGAFARAAAAEDAALDRLIGDTQHGGFGQNFDDASRTIRMPRATEPTVSAATAQTTEKAIDRYADIVARGGWPSVPSVSVLRVGDRHAAVPVLRARLAVSGDIDPNAAGNDIYNSYVEAAVRRFQARHGLTIDGVIRPETLAAINVPAPTRLGQLKINVTRLRALSANLARATWSATFRRRASKRSRMAWRCRVTPPWSASRIGRRPRSTRRSSRSTSIRIGRCRRRSCSGISFRKCRISRIISPATTSASSTRDTGSCSRRRSTGIRKTPPIIRSSRIPAASTRSVRSASTFRAPSACICTIRR